MKKVIPILMGTFLLYAIFLVTATGCTSVLNCGVGEVCEHNQCVTHPPTPPVQNFVAPSPTADNGTTPILWVGIIIALLLIVIVYALLRKKK